MSDDEERHVPHHEPGVGHIVEFDLPHARVTLKQFLFVPNEQDPALEIEVWPKQGVSSFVVLPLRVANLVANKITEMTAELEAQGTEIPPENVVAFGPKKKGRKLKN